MDPPEMSPLKQKLKDHWNTRDQMLNIRPERANLLGVSFFWGFTFSLMFSSLWITMSNLNREDSGGEFWMACGIWWIFVQSVVNWILCVKIDPSVSKSGLSPPSQDQMPLMQQLPEGWHTCLLCNIDVPTRSHHCKICKTCVLKRDHHCFFTGYCIGFNNQRRFIVFVFYIVIGSLVGITLILNYLSDPLPLRSSYGWSYVPFVALWQWVCGYIKTAHFLLLLQMYFCIATAFVSGCFFLWEISMTYRGQSSYEAQKGVHRYRTDVTTHFRSVFGPLKFVPIHFIFPLPIRQEGDGATWPTHKLTKGN